MKLKYDFNHYEFEWEYDADMGEVSNIVIPLIAHERGCSLDDAADWWEIENYMNDDIYDHLLEYFKAEAYAEYLEHVQYLKELERDRWRPL